MTAFTPPDLAICPLDNPWGKQFLARHICHVSRDDCDRMPIVHLRPSSESSAGNTTYRPLVTSPLAISHATYPPDHHRICPPKIQRLTTVYLWFLPDSSCKEIFVVHTLDLMAHDFLPPRLLVLLAKCCPPFICTI